MKALLLVALSAWLVCANARGNEPSSGAGGTGGRTIIAGTHAENNQAATPVSNSDTPLPL